MRLLGLLIALALLLVGSDAFFQRFSSSRHRKNAGTQAADGNVQPFIRFRKSYEWNPLNRFDYGNDDDFLGDPFLRASAGAVAAPQ
uniref:Uncharacterized protein n=1 Tax=Steinernema glaseri TaxID=37863 RepID=A0A1I8AET3_9BILA